MQTGEIWLLLWVKPQKLCEASFSFLLLPLILPTYTLCNPSMKTKNRKQLSITGDPLREIPAKPEALRKLQAD